MNWLIGIHELTDGQMELASKNNLNKNTVRKRIVYHGWDVDKAVSTPVNTEKIWTKEDIQDAERNGISSATFRKRITEYNYTVEQAKTIPLNENRRSEKLSRIERTSSDYRTLIRGKSKEQVIRRAAALKSRGWVPLMDEPKLDPGNLYAAETESYVMVLEVAHCKHI